MGIPTGLSVQLHIALCGWRIGAGVSLMVAKAHSLPCGG